MRCDFAGLVAGLFRYNFVSQGCKALLGGLYFVFTSGCHGWEVYRSHNGHKVISGHHLSRLALRVIQQGQTSQVSYYMGVGAKKSVKTVSP